MIDVVVLVVTKIKKMYLTFKELEIGQFFRILNDTRIWVKLDRGWAMNIANSQEIEKAYPNWPVKSIDAKTNLYRFHRTKPPYIDLRNTK